MISRRKAMLAAGAAGLVISGQIRAQDGALGGENLARRIRAIEAESGGRLGVAVRETGTGRSFAHRGDERFPLCSTFKFLLAAAVLKAVDDGRERLDRALPVSRGDMIAHAPVTERLVGRTATIGELADAIMTWSDNPAANLLLRTIGGPAGLTRFCRAIGDEVTRLDRYELELNEALPGDERDTTSPSAMLGDLDRLVLGTALSAASRERLTGWLVGNRTGDARLRAGLPATWRAGDRTGTGARGTANDIGVLWPPNGAPVIVTSYLTGSSLNGAGQSAIHAQVARAVVAALASQT